MKLKSLSLPDAEQVRQWRNEQLDMLRTSFPLTQEQQEQFYREVVCNRQANAKFWGIVCNVPNIVNMYHAESDKPYETFESNTTHKELIGMCGLENISWENRNAEISMVLNPEYPLDKYGEEALGLLLHEGFMNLNLENIFAEVYACNPNMEFWTDVINKYKCITAFLPYRKYYNGQWYSSTYININKGAYPYEHTVSQPAHSPD
jgi:RimJ/RimL family protein N-acetyltransferase